MYPAGTVAEALIHSENTHSVRAARLRHNDAPGVDAEGRSWCNRGFASERSLPARDNNMKRTYQASKTRRARTHGFLVRMKSRGGRAVINARRAKGRKRLAV